MVTAHSRETPIVTNRRFGHAVVTIVPTSVSKKHGRSVDPLLLAPQELTTQRVKHDGGSFRRSPLFASKSQAISRVGKDLQDRDFGKAGGDCARPRGAR